MRYCPFCGSANEDGYRFCTGCGKNINGEAPAETKNFQTGYWPAWKDAPTDRTPVRKNGDPVSDLSIGNSVRRENQPWEQDPEDFLKQFDEMYYSPRPHSSAGRTNGNGVPNNSENGTTSNAAQPVSVSPAYSDPRIGSNRADANSIPTVTGRTAYTTVESSPPQGRGEPHPAGQAYVSSPSGNTAAGSFSLQQTSESRSFSQVSSADPVTKPGHISTEYSAQYSGSVRNTAAVPLFSEDKGGFGWWVLGFLLPLAGLVIYLSTRKTHPKRGHSAAVGALVMLILAAVTAALFMFGVLKGVIALV